MSETFKEKTQHFFLTNKFLRKIRNFFHQTFFPILIKSLLILTVLLASIFMGLKFFKPKYLETIYQKSAFYFFHSLNLDSSNFTQINIAGNNHTTVEEILVIVESSKTQTSNYKSGDYQLFTHNLIDQMKAQLPWINQVIITRSMPDILNISVTEYEPFAIWQNEGKKYFTDKEGNLVPFVEMEEFEHMVILSGKGANTHARSLFNIFATDPNLSANVYSATWVSNRRWDIRFDNGLLIKLPENNISEAWQRLMKIYNMQGSIVGLKIIDLRILDKTYLEYEDAVIKELKSL